MSDSSASASSSSKGHPEWLGPHGPSSSSLLVHNSLTSTRVPFVTADPHQRRVGWYTCGPTVYDSAHLGHARCYVTFDIIRRIMSDYFKYNVFYVMNITDLDDKIILRARRNHLLKEYSSAATDVAQVSRDVSEAFAKAVEGQRNKVAKAEETWKASVEKKLRYADEHKTALEEEEAKLKLLQSEQQKYEAAVAASASQPASEAIQSLLSAGKGPLSEWLDASRGASVTDHSIFKAHASYYEKEFLEDMRALGVRDPDALTRVTEYVQHIVKYVEKIIANGFAYEKDGSVYFDTAAFTAAGYHYAKLSPWSVGNTQLVQSGEGSLSGDALGRKSGMDFALWKTSKRGEPEWDSPWGKGRPGWHIECSAMASDLLGTTFDVHSGGVDLKFPHHDNEIAQSEGHGQCAQWVNHFWHAGHLNIAGLKMSKSLKNFITIRDVLSSHSGRVLRFLFLLTPWDTTMNFSDDSLRAATTREKEFAEFFANVAADVRAKAAIDAHPQLWNDADRVLHAKLQTTRDGVDAALKDNFDYPRAMALMSDLIGDTNKYRANNAEYKAMLLTQIARYIDGMMRVFGVQPDPEPSFVSTSGGEGAGAGSKLSGVLDAAALFRDQMREAIRAKKSPADLLALCDAFRDEGMLRLGVRLEDATGADGSVRSVWKLDDPAKLLREREEKRAAERATRIAKLGNKADKLTKDLAKLADAAIAPKDYFAALKVTAATNAASSPTAAAADGAASSTAAAAPAVGAPLYAQFDASGKPTHDALGAELSKSASKSVSKTWDTRDKAHKDYLAKLEKNPNTVADMEKELAQLRAELQAAQAEQQ